MADLVLIGLGLSVLDIGAQHPGLQRTWDYRWEAVNRVGNRPAMQFMGPGEETVRLHGIIYPHYMGGFGLLEDMRQEAAKGKTRGLVSGFGRYYGKWCIKSIKDDQSLFFADGPPRKVEFDIELTHYG